MTEHRSARVESLMDDHEQLRLNSGVALFSKEKSRKLDFSFNITRVELVSVYLLYAFES